MKKPTAEGLRKWFTRKRHALEARHLDQASALTLKGRAVDADGGMEWSLSRGGKLVSRWREADAPGLFAELHELLMVIGMIARDVQEQTQATSRGGKKSGASRRRASAAEQIRKMIARSPGWTNGQIADECGVTVQYVSKIRRSVGD